MQIKYDGRAMPHSLYPSLVAGLCTPDIHWPSLSELSTHLSYDSGPVGNKLQFLVINSYYGPNEDPYAHFESKHDISCFSLSFVTTISPYHLPCLLIYYPISAPLG